VYKYLVAVKRVQKFIVYYVHFNFQLQYWLLYHVHSNS